MTNFKKAPAYDKAKATLDSHLAKTGKILTIRQLKAACGGVGSNETYQQYMGQWREDRMKASGLNATLLAIRNQTESHAAIMKSLIDQAMLQIALSAVADDIVATDAEKVEEIDPDCEIDGEPVLRTEGEQVSEGKADDPNRIESAGSSCATPVAPAHEMSRSEEPAISSTPERTRSADEIDALAKAFVASSEPLFLDASESPSGSEDHTQHGDHVESRSALVPTVQDTTTNAHASLSRFDGGGQQATLPLESNKPEQGESDTSGGSANGTA